MHIDEKECWKLLVVEDNDLDVELLMFYMERIDSSISVQRAVNGEEALQLFLDAFEKNSSNVKFIVLLDLNMPRMNGFELLERIHDKPWYEHLRVCILSTSSQSEDHERALSLGASTYLTKPIDKSILTKVLEDNGALENSALPQSKAA